MYIIQQKILMLTLSIFELGFLVISSVLMRLHLLHVSTVCRTYFITWQPYPAVCGTGLSNEGLPRSKRMWLPSSSVLTLRDSASPEFTTCKPLKFSANRCQDTSLSRTTAVYTKAWLPSQEDFQWSCSKILQGQFPCEKPSPNSTSYFWDSLSIRRLLLQVWSGNHFLKISSLWGLQWGLLDLIKQFVQFSWEVLPHLATSSNDVPVKYLT